MIGKPSSVIFRLSELAHRVEECAQQEQKVEDLPEVKKKVINQIATPDINKKVINWITTLEVNKKDINQIATPEINKKVIN